MKTFVLNMKYISLVAMVLFLGVFNSNNHAYAQDCSADLPKLATQCLQFVQPGPKVPPSDGCCAIVKVVDMPCVCKHVTPEVEKLVDMEKVVYIAETCGRPIAPGTKCGSYTVPPHM